VLDKPYYFPQFENLTSVGEWNAPDYEKIGELAKGDDGKIAPGTVVIGYSYPDQPYGIYGVEEGLAPYEDILSVGLDFYKPENMTHEITTLGQILNEGAKAQDYNNWYNTTTSDVEKASIGLKRPKVYAEWSSTAGELSTLGAGSGFNQVLDLANGYNIAGDLGSAYPKVSWEWVVTQNPEVILKRQTHSSNQTQMGWQSEPSSDAVMLDGARNEVLSRPAASNISAVKDGKVYVMDWDILNGMDQPVGLTYVAKLIHPELDLDPVKVHKEYLQRLGLEYPEDRTFVYPELE
jgi:iron complex transport system substrate-binding protein